MGLRAKLVSTASHVHHPAPLGGRKVTAAESTRAGWRHSGRDPKTQSGRLKAEGMNRGPRLPDSGRNRLAALHSPREATRPRRPTSVRSHNPPRFTFLLPPAKTSILACCPSLDNPTPSFFYRRVPLHYSLARRPGPRGRSFLPAGAVSPLSSTRG
jgi:hypothetical protein